MSLLCTFPTFAVFLRSVLFFLLTFCWLFVCCCTYLLQSTLVTPHQGSLASKSCFSAELLADAEGDADAEGEEEGDGEGEDDEDDSPVASLAATHSSPSTPIKIATSTSTSTPTITNANTNTKTNTNSNTTIYAAEEVIGFLCIDILLLPFSPTCFSISLSFFSITNHFRILTQCHFTTVRFCHDGPVLLLDQHRCQ